MVELIRLNDMDNFKRLLKAVSPALDYIYHPKIYLALSDLVEWVIQPIYNNIIQNHSTLQTDTGLASFPEGKFKQMS